MITPQPQAKKLALALGFADELYLKREDLHPYGSHKGRSIPPMINHYAGQGEKDFCISSSGNAALAAIFAVEELNKKDTARPLNLRVFVGKNIESDKLKKLQQTISDSKNISIEQVENPKQTAFQTEKDGSARNLRQSTDDAALAGYETLAAELAEIENLAAVFVPTSSGTTAQGLYEAFSKQGLCPQIHIVQTTGCHTMIDSSAPTETSLANAIVDKVGHRKEAVQKIVLDSKGGAWIADNKAIAEAIQQIKETEDIEVSPNSALSVAGLKLALANGQKFNGAVVCLITGR